MQRKIKKIIISPPFSNLRLLCPPNTTRVLGTYTLNKRRGLWRVLTTLKRIEGGWVNNVGLRNGGVQSVPNLKDTIISFSALEEQDWCFALPQLKLRDKVMGLEINISCPNVGVKNIPKKKIQEIKDSFKNVIVKTPHHTSLCDLIKLADLGFDYIHVSNTAPSEIGAISGLSLVEKNLRTISKIKSFRPSVKIIGGGGIYTMETLKKYENVGADHFSLSTLLLNPIKTRKLINQYYLNYSKKSNSP